MPDVHTFLCSMQLAIHPAPEFHEQSEQQQRDLMLQFSAEVLEPTSVMDEVISIWRQFPLTLDADSAYKEQDQATRAAIKEKLKEYNQRIRPSQTSVILPPMTGGPGYQYMDHMLAEYIHIPGDGIICRGSYELFLSGETSPWEIVQGGIAATAWLSLAMELQLN